LTLDEIQTLLVLILRMCMLAYSAGSVHMPFLRNIRRCTEHIIAERRC